MKVLILTCSESGTALLALNKLVNQKEIEIAAIIVSKQINSNKIKFIKSKIKKIFNIGFFGALNGIRIRSWFYLNTDNYGKLTDVAKNYNIPVHFVDHINNINTIDIIQNSDANLGLSLGNSYISPRVFNSFKLGMINIHGEVLPKYQNAQSVIWQIYNKSYTTGFTIHKVEKKIDAGKILYKEEFPIIFLGNFKKTVLHNCKNIAEHATNALVKVILNYDYYLSNAIEQKESDHYTTPTIWQFVKMTFNFKKMSINK